MEEQQLVCAVLSGAPARADGPGVAEITAELRRIYAGKKNLDGYAAMAALDLGEDLPKGIRVLMDRITFADTPFCGSLSAYLEQALAGQLAAFGQVKILDKTQARGAIQKGRTYPDLPAELLFSDLEIKLLQAFADTMGGKKNSSPQPS
jgi:hypothetical protein